VKKLTGQERQTINKLTTLLLIIFKKDIRMTKRSFQLIMFIFLAFQMTGCATLFKGADDTVNVSVTDCQPAKCVASNTKGQYPIASVPGPVLVQKTKAPLVISCESPAGEKAATSLESGTEGWVWGNILIGGLIGLVIDMSTDSIHNYDDEAVVPLSCES